jgi:hypothetical protein
MYSVFTDRHKILTHFICLRSENPRKYEKRKMKKLFSSHKKKHKVFSSSLLPWTARAIKKKRQKVKNKKIGKMQKTKSFGIKFKYLHPKSWCMGRKSKLTSDWNSLKQKPGNKLLISRFESEKMSMIFA